MTITLDVPGDVAQRLSVEARRLGLSIDQFVLRAAVGHLDGISSRISAVGAPTHDPYLATAAVRSRAAAQELETLGITDGKGKRLRTDLPEDMREGADRDFGG